VDWCDAFAYCQGVGKRLCGKIGGGANGYGDYANASLSQWYHACVSDGANSTYVYGNTYQPYYCNGTDYGARTTVPAGSMPNCQSSVSGYHGVYDLTGNVYEWEDSCDEEGLGGFCRLRGGTFYGSDVVLRCAGSDYLVRGLVLNNIGFRCCS
jgi:formylglycine-generating enzyme required for sulfatase activity